jgi:hypothetical protein
MENTKPVPYKNWPWWVKFIMSVSTQYDAKPERTISLAIIALFLISFMQLVPIVFNFEDGEGFGPLIINTRNNGRFLFIINLFALSLWHALAALWVRENSSQELINVNIFKRILIGLLILLIFVGIPIYFNGL